MKNHLFQFHQNEYDAIFAKKQVAITEHFNSSAIITKETQFNALARFICKNYQPISVIENNDFRDFLKTVAPQFSLPNRASMKAVIHNKFIALKAKLTILIKNNKLSLTTDGWTSKSKHTYFCYTLHWIDETFKLHSCPLAITVSTGRSTADVHLQALLNELQKHNISLKDII